MIKYLFKRIFYLFFPPIFTRIFLKKGNEFKKRIIWKVSENEKIDFIKYNKNNAFEIDRNKLRYFGGLKFNREDHPFLKYLLGNENEMLDFYSNHKPKNIFECHKLNAKNTFIDSNFFIEPSSCLPWLHDTTDTLAQVEGNLDISDGRQQFGPISKKKLNFEINRLRKVKISVEKKGFIPEKFEGYPRGYFMQNNSGQWIFNIVGGSHRVAALISLNYDYIPVILQPDYTDVVLENDIDQWPKIKDNKMSKSDAIKIFLSYF